MSYFFIAEFYRDRISETPLYTTHLWGLPDDEASIKALGFDEDPLSLPESIDFIKEVTPCELHSICSIEDNPELGDILTKGEDCKKVIVSACQYDGELNISCSFGAEETLWANFSGNMPNSRVKVSHMYFPAKVDLPLRCFKDKLGVLTVYEVIDCLEKEFSHLTPEDLEMMQEDFSSGMDRAIDIVTEKFAEELDLDGHSQLMHMTAVSTAGQNDDERLVGMLHDLVEDTEWTFEDLLFDGFPPRIVDTLRLLTHDKQIPYMDYIKNICESGNQVALAVKINDLNHNLKRGRAGGHWQHVAKHEKALAHIQDFIQRNSQSDEQRED